MISDGTFCSMDLGRISDCLIVEREENEVIVNDSGFNGTSVFTATRIGWTVNDSIFLELSEIINWFVFNCRKQFVSISFLYNEKFLGGFAGGELISTDDDEPDSSFWRGGLAGGGVIALKLVDSYESTDNSFNWWSEFSINIDDGLENDWTIGWCVLVNCCSFIFESKDFFLLIVLFIGLTTAFLSTLANARAWSGIIFDFIKRSPTRVGAVTTKKKIWLVYLRISSSIWDVCSVNCCVRICSSFWIDEPNIWLSGEVGVASWTILTIPKSPNFVGDFFDWNSKIN